MATLASPPSLERGLVYLAEGRVGPLRVSAGRVAANVRGAASYAVELRDDGGRLRFSCSCPVGRDGAFCKHCVAVALSWLGDRGPSVPTLDDARAVLESLPPEDVVDLLIDHAHEDDGLARKLLLMASRRASTARVDIASLHTLTGQTFACHGFVSYREVYGYVRGIEETIDVLEGLLAAGHADELVEVAEYALAAAERALDHVDDSDGQMREVVERLEQLHLEGGV